LIFLLLSDTVNVTQSAKAKHRLFGSQNKLKRTNVFFLFQNCLLKNKNSLSVK